MDKELRKLNREELLELLLVQTKEVEKLRAELDEAHRLLNERRLHIENVGNLAEAMIEVNGVMAAAQAAADQYLENMAVLEAETKHRCEEMIRYAIAESKRIRLTLSEDTEMEIDKQDDEHR